MNTKKGSVKVRFARQKIILDFADGRTFAAPLAMYPRLLHATPGQRAEWEIIGNNRGIHWPQLDEDLSIEGLLHGIPAMKRQAGRTAGKIPPSELRA